jgi:hypothetical protein
MTVEPLRVVRHDSAVGSWETAIGKPHRAIRGLVAGDYQGWTQHSASFGSRREIAIPVVPTIINLGPSFRLIDPHRNTSELHGSFVAGMHDRYLLVETTGPSVAMQANFTPIGARLVFGLPMDEISNRVV